MNIKLGYRNNAYNTKLETEPTVLMTFICNI